MKADHTVPRRRNRPRALQTLLAAIPCLLLLAACAGDHPGSTLDPVTRDFGGSIHGLYVTVFWWTMLILAVVWTLLAYILVRFRERPDAEPSTTRGNLALEIGWTLGPAIIVVLIAVPTIQAVFRTQQPAPENALVVDVVGHQWWWEFRYPDHDVITANELHVPVGRPVELRLTSADVIHSFWVPRIGGKRDVNPVVERPAGQERPPNRLVFAVDEPGNYPGQCAEFCGESHGLMGLRVIAESPSEFQAWLSAMQEPVRPDSGTEADRGRQIFMRSTCVACHAIAGTQAQGRLGPDLTRVGARTSLGANTLGNTRQNLIRWITDPEAIKPGVEMPGVENGGGGFPPTGLSQDEVAAVAAYLSNLNGQVTDR